MRKYDKNIRKKVNKNNKKLKVIEINLSTLITVSAMISILFILFLGHEISIVETKIVANLMEEATVSSNTDLSDYKATEELTDEDMEDEYQKNYQETTVDDDNYLIKTAEWTDKENGEALITINGSLTVEPEETTALYVATLCYSHGLTEDIVVENIQYLVKNYDYVDFIGINTSLEIGIMEVKTFTSDITEEEIRTYLQDARNEFGNYYPHYTLSVPVAIQKYLFGGYGDEYISTDNLQNDPIAIYVSCDTMYLNNNSSTDMYGLEYATEKYFNFMYENYGNVYFTMSQYSQQDSDPKIIIRYANNSTYDSDVMNAIIGILNPENYGEADNTLSEESLATWASSTTETINLSFTDVKYAADYSYSENFEKAGVKIIVGATIVDVVVGEYEIVSVEAYDSSGNEITVTINGQTVTITDPDYVTGDEITILIYIKLNSSVATNFDDFLDTNEGTATMSNNFNGESVEVSSPKLVPNTNSYKVQYVDLNTGETIKDEKTEENIAINTEITATNEVIEIDDYTYVKASEDTLTVTSDENVLILYYAKTTSVIVYYLDYYTDEEIAESETIDGYEGLSYTTQQKEIDEYTYLSNSGNTEGTMSSETTYVYYYYEQLISITITKVSTETSTDEDGNTVYTYLEGVQFQLYELICDNAAHNHDTDEDLIDTEDYDEDCWELIGTYTTEENGTFILSDLPITGIYRLVETKVVEDYLLPNGQWKIEFNYGNLTGDNTVVDYNGQGVKVTAIGNPPALSLQTVEEEDILYLYNSLSYDIPSTGSFETNNFYWVGIPITLLGVFIIVVRKRLKYAIGKFSSLRNSVNDARRIIDNWDKNS